MYKALTKDYFIKNLNLSENYKVDGILINGSGNREKQLASFNEALKEFNYVEEPRLEHEFFSRVKVFTINNKRIWFDVVYGGAYMSELLHVACLLGSQKNIFTGSVGGLQKGSKSGDLIIPTYSFGDESSTRMYARDNLDNRYYPNKNLSSVIKAKISSEFKVAEGPLITCQAMLAETQEDVLMWSNEKYLGVEMETATFFAVSNHFKVPSSALLYISDNLIEGEIVNSESHLLAKERRDLAKVHNYKIALEVLTA